MDIWQYIKTIDLSTHGDLQDVNLSDKYGKTMAHITAIYGLLKILKIRYKEDPKSSSSREHYGFTCAHVWAPRGHVPTQNVF